MEDKVFNLLEKMYADLMEKIDGVNNEVKKNSEDIRKTNILIENDIKPNVDMCIEEIIGKTYVPLRVISEIFNNDVTWDKKARKLVFKDRDIESI